MKTQYIVEAYEEEIGSELFIVTVPEGTDETEVYKNFEMAEKYAWVCFGDNPEDYDEHFEDMVGFRERGNGQDAFNHYLEEYCGYKIESLEYDFRYEW